MWKQLWQKWTLDKPEAFGDWLWEVFVVQLAAWLDRLTIRRAIALIPILILAVAYFHHVPLHPGVMLLGDVLAYLDLFSILFLVGLLSRATTILLIVKQVAGGTLRLARGMLARVQRFDIRHRRESSSSMARKRRMSQARKEDDEAAVVYGVAWA